MNLLGRVSVFPVLPERIQGLRDLAHNMWWSWNPEAQGLFIRLDEGLWNKVYHNPVKFLSEIDQQRLDAAAKDAGYTQAYDAVMARFGAYVNQAKTWFKDTYPDAVGKTVAYFSAEFGLHESLPIYSGGLGILAGDHLKSASDLGIPLIGVGLLYNQGYFRQSLDANGWQQESYLNADTELLPIEKVLGPDGKPLMVAIETATGTLRARIWRAEVGRTRPTSIRSVVVY